jgi:hypothetical protein
LSADVVECESSIWWDDLRRIAIAFEKNLNEIGNKGSIFVQYEPSQLESAFEVYARGRICFKEHIYGEDAKIELIDRHKITALYILSILIKRPFSLRGNLEERNIDQRLLLANELYSLAVMVALLRSWNNGKVCEIGENEKRWLLILANHLKLDLKEQKATYIKPDNATITNILSLAQIIYYIEDKAFHRV